MPLNRLPDKQPRIDMIIHNNVKAAHVALHSMEQAGCVFAETPDVRTSVRPEDIVGRNIVIVLSFPASATNMPPVAPTNSLPLIKEQFGLTAEDLRKAADVILAATVDNPENN